MKLDMTEYMNEWIERLGLKDWDIKLKMHCHPDEMEECCGLTVYNIIHKQAIIKLLDQAMYNNPDFPYNTPRTILHELLHLKFAIIDDMGDELYRRCIHMMVDEFAGILYNLNI